MSYRVFVVGEGVSEVMNLDNVVISGKGTDSPDPQITRIEVAALGFNSLAEAGVQIAYALADVAKQTDNILAAQSFIITTSKTAMEILNEED